MYDSFNISSKPFKVHGAVVFKHLNLAWISHGFPCQRATAGSYWCPPSSRQTTRAAHSGPYWPAPGTSWPTVPSRATVLLLQSSFWVILGLDASWCFLMLLAPQMHTQRQRAISEGEIFANLTLQNEQKRASQWQRKKSLANLKSATKTRWNTMKTQYR